MERSRRQSVAPEEEDQLDNQEKKVDHSFETLINYYMCH
jgi:hypothetical protein